MPVITTPARKSKPARKATVRREHTRSIGWACRLSHATGVLRITQDGDTTHYFCSPVPAGYGVGVHLEKIDQTEGAVSASYHVNVHGDASTCECRGFLRFGYCKHLDGLTALVARDAL
jgi:hypothetical protein